MVVRLGFACLIIWIAGVVLNYMAGGLLHLFLMAGVACLWLRYEDIGPAKQELSLEPDEAPDPRLARPEPHWRAVPAELNLSGGVHDTGH